ncbi:hypothetical protein ACFL2O_07855 [Thermodesulfobacteriota bacterium]
MSNKIVQCLWAALFLPLIASNAGADGSWRTRGIIDVAAPGIVETVVPPELVSRSDDGFMDVTLTGPDGGTRGFELYWREQMDNVSHFLTASKVTLDDQKGFVWEAALPERLLTRQLVVQVSADHYIGKVNVEGFRMGRWSILVSNAALFKAYGNLRGQIDIPKADYERLRLYFSGLDKSAKQMISPIKTVKAVGERLGKDFAKRRLSLPFQQSQTQTATVIEAVLPSKGLWLGALTVKTEAQFQGSWQVGRDTIVSGQKKFVVIKSGRVAYVGRRQQVLTIDLDNTWKGNSLVLKLDTGHRYLGAVTELTVDVRLPRMVFVADRPGRYIFYTGADQKVSVLNSPGDAQRLPDIETTVKQIEINPQWRPLPLVERFQIKGAPFDPTGYTWQSSLQINQAGYYRLPLSLAAVLKSQAGSIRVVRDGMQVPYILGHDQTQSIDIDAEEEFDNKTNQSRWTIELPGPSTHWQRLTLRAEGIFRRTIHWERPKPGNMGWKTWRTGVWENRNSKETAFVLSLGELPNEMDHIRLVINNGDNQPIKISRVTAEYAAPTYFFLAHGPGAYLVYGGNPQAGIPQYDFSLVENELLAELPQSVQMGDLELFQQPGWKNQLVAAFKDTGWGLYAVLGLVTLVLIVVIVRLFPKESGK